MSDGHKPGDKDLSGYRFSPGTGPGGDGRTQMTPLPLRQGAVPAPTPLGLRPRAAPPQVQRPSAPPPSPRPDTNQSEDDERGRRIQTPGSAGNHDSRGSVESNCEREERIVCSFPGLLKVLIPEESFVPFPVAVRVANLSAGGVMVEAHDTVKINPDRLITNRYFELKVAHTEIPDLRGRIAWTDFSGKNPRLGLSCFQRSPELGRIVQMSESAIQWEGPPPLATPEIDPFPPTSAEPKVVLSGRASEAMEVIVKGAHSRFTAPVSKGVFRIVVELEDESENHFLLRAYAGERRSRAIPIRVVYEKSARKGSFYFDARMEQGKKGGVTTITLDFNGSVRQAERVLYRFSQLMGSSERVSLSSKLYSPVGFDKRLFETLRSEGAVLAADTTKNQVAAKLLDDLL